MLGTPINIEKSIKKNRAINKFMKFVLSSITIFTFAMVLILLLKILSKGLTTIDFDFLVGLPEEIDAGGGIGPFIFYSFHSSSQFQSVLVLVSI